MASVLLQRNALVHILASMTRREAARLAPTCKLFREAFAGIERLGLRHAPTLLVACSGTCTLVEVDPRSRQVSRLCPLSIHLKPHKNSTPPRWATSITAHRGVVYASQYQVGQRPGLPHRPA
jgi:hypothetical protein